MDECPGLASIAYHDVKDNTRMEKKTENRRKFTAVPESPISPTSPASAALYYSESEDDTEDDHQSPISSKSPSAQTTPSQSPVADRLPRIAPSTNSTPSQSPVLDRIPHIVPSTNLTPSHSPVLDRVSRISPSTNSPSQSPVFERSSHISPSMNITPLQSSARQSTSSNSPWTGRSSATSLATSSTSAKEDQKKSDSEAEDIIDFFETINNIEIQGITSSRRQTMSGRERLKSYSRRHQNPHKNEKLLKKDALERTLKAKECELEEIEKLLHGSATKESLKHWKDSHPEYCGKHKDVKKKQKDLKSKNSSKKTPSPEKKRKSRAKDGKKSTKEDESEKGSDIDYHETHL
uniref:Cylicin-2-like n=1 Tax=Saccoglossus kowalevskii TaxID=10224 RepID=A0ABM0M7R9_SACKO|nr:PREDICTED: cylicin-2-like [Saccoglossus kowalevskii]